MKVILIFKKLANIFQVSDERREQGRVSNTKEAYGFIQCADRDAKIFFPLSECLDVTRQVKENDDCEFTVADDPNQPGKLMATRIKLLSAGKYSLTIFSDKVPNLSKFFKNRKIPNSK